MRRLVRETQLSTSNFIYPYFVTNIWVMLGIAVGLLVLLWLLIRMGH